MSLPRVLVAGYATVDLVFHGFDDVPPPGGTVQAEGLDVSPGGHGVNVPVDMVRLGYDPSRVVPHFKVGDDYFGSLVLSYVRSFGLEPCSAVAAGARTPIVAVLSPRRSDRRFVNYSGASDLFSAEELSRCAEGADVVYVTTGVWARAGGPGLGRGAALRVVDFSAVPARLAGRVPEALEWADVVHGSPAELSAALGASSYVEAARRLLDRGAALVLVTKGGEGAEALRGDVAVRQPAYEVRAVDPTGAGDAFVAAFLVWLARAGAAARGRLLSLGAGELADALAYAQAAGAAAVTAYGATAGVSRDAVEALYKSQGRRLVEAAEVLRGWAP